jgi:hypothetical protein
MNVMMFALHSCRDTFSSYFHSGGNEEEMKTDISLINLQSYFLFCMLNKYELYYFEIRYRRQPSCSYGRLFILRIIIRTVIPQNSGVLFSELYILCQSVSFFFETGSKYIYNEHNRHRASTELQNEWSCTSTVSMPSWHV